MVMSIHLDESGRFDGSEESLIGGILLPDQPQRNPALGDSWLKISRLFINRLVGCGHPTLAQRFSSARRVGSTWESTRDAWLNRGDLEKLPRLVPFGHVGGCLATL